MKSTPIARVRVSFEDAMSIVDVLKQSGLPLEEMSFNSMAGLVLSGNLQALRDKGVVPTRHQDEFDAVCGPYIREGDKSNKDVRKLMVSAAVQGKGFNLAAYEEEHDADLPESK